jgi:protein-tyrosine phosphatase
MFGLFKKKPKEPTLNFNVIGVDMHSHVLPGIDDGAVTVDDSIILIKELIGVGIKKVIATPHVMYDYYRNTPETVNNALAVLKAELLKQQVNIPIEAAAEYFFDEHFIKLVQTGGDLLTIGKKHVLMEFSFVSPPPEFIPTLQKLKQDGYKPILAHPERYPYYKIDDLQNLRDWGFQLQVNTISLTGYYGKETKKMAEDLIDRQLVDFIASDMHHPRHAEALTQALQMPYVQKLLKGYPLKNSLLL